MNDKIPDKPHLRYTKAITVRIEPELWQEFQALKQTSKKDIGEAQRIFLRKCAQELKNEAS